MMVKLALTCSDSEDTNGGHTAVAAARSPLVRVAWTGVPGVPRASGSGVIRSRIVHAMHRL